MRICQNHIFVETRFVEHPARHQHCFKDAADALRCEPSQGMRADKVWHGTKTSRDATV